MKKYIVCVLAVLVLLCLGGCRKAEKIPELLEPVGIKIDTATAEVSDLYSLEVYNGEVVPYVEMISFEADGLLQDFQVSMGKAIEAGQVLATLDQEELLEQLEELEEKIQDLTITGSFEDRKMTADIEIAIEQLEMLKSRNAGSESILTKELELKMLKLDLQEGQEIRALELNRLEKQKQEYREELKKTKITAPFSGKVVYTSPVSAQTFIKSQTPVVGIADESRLTITSEYISPTRIENAYRISAQILDQEFDVYYEPYNDSEYVKLLLSGETVTSKFTFGEDVQVESGQYAVIKLWNFLEKNVLTIPVNTLYRDEKGYYVYKIEEDQRIRCNITIGTTTETKVEVLEGLKEGDVVYVKE